MPSAKLKGTVLHPKQRCCAGERQFLWVESLLQRAIANGVNVRLIRLASRSNIHNNSSFQRSAVLEALA
jgi:hypothetical protein